MAAPAGDPGRKRPKRRRLSRSGEFERVYREGRSHGGRDLVLHAFPRTADGDGPRLGVSVGRKVGGAVERNRVKRLLREAFWASAGPLPDTHDFVIVARPGAAKLAEERGEEGFREALAELVSASGLADAPNGGDAAEGDLGAEGEGSA